MGEVWKRRIEHLEALLYRYREKDVISHRMGLTEAKARLRNLQLQTVSAPVSARTTPRLGTGFGNLGRLSVTSSRRSSAAASDSRPHTAR